MQTLAGVYNNWLFVQVITISGFLPITFTLLGLHILHKISWYLIFLSCGSIILSTAYFCTWDILDSLFLFLRKDLNNLKDVFDNGGLPECQHKQLWVYCDSHIQDLTTNFIEVYQDTRLILAGCLCTFVALTLDKSIRNPPDFLLLAKSIWQRTKPMRKAVGKGTTLILRINAIGKRVWYRITSYTTKRPWGRINLSTHIPVLSAIWRTIRRLEARLLSSRQTPKAWRIAIYSLLVGWYSCCFYLYLRVLRIFATQHVYSDKWSFGQVIALLVWVPPTCEYLNNEIRKLPSAVFLGLFRQGRLQLTTPPPPLPGALFLY